MIIDRQETTITTPPTPYDLEKKVNAIITSLDDDKGRDIMQFDLAGKTAMADRMIVASGTSTRQVTAMADHLVSKLKALGLFARSEGKKQGDWVLVDAGDVVVHLFRPEVRAFYDIERLWAGQTPMPVTLPAPKPVITVSTPPVAAPMAEKPIVKKPTVKKAAVKKPAVKQTEKKAPARKAAKPKVAKPKRKPAKLAAKKPAARKVAKPAAPKRKAAPKKKAPTPKRKALLPKKKAPATKKKVAKRKRK